MTDVSLKWGDHRASVISVMDRMLKSQQFVDVTLATEGQYLRVHGLVLCACSAYFEVSSAIIFTTLIMFVECYLFTRNY